MLTLIPRIHNSGEKRNIVDRTYYSNTVVRLSALLGNTEIYIPKRDFLSMDINYTCQFGELRI